ncbi:hypothetical protein SLE2022_109080 [Rubroshorea leprosula]
MPLLEFLFHCLSQLNCIFDPLSNGFRHSSVLAMNYDKIDFIGGSRRDEEKWRDSSSRRLGHDGDCTIRATLNLWHCILCMLVIMASNIYDTPRVSLSSGLIFNG